MQPFARGKPAIDMHAHIEPSIPPERLVELGAVVFAATRTLVEAANVLSRKDEWTIWGVGCHPRLASAQRAFDEERFAELIEDSAFVSEIGLDGSTPSGMERQRDTFASILSVLSERPRIASIHNYKAAVDVVDMLSAHPVKGVVLHWWLGDRETTERAIELGCFFSVNSSSVRRRDLLEVIPFERILTETDHPFGDRRLKNAARPGNVTDVEQTLARHYGLDPAALRSLLWSNLAALISSTRTGPLLPRAVRTQVLAA